MLDLQLKIHSTLPIQFAIKEIRKIKMLICHFAKKSTSISPSDALLTCQWWADIEKMEGEKRVLTVVFGVDSLQG